MKSKEMNIQRDRESSRKIDSSLEKDSSLMS